MGSRGHDWAPSVPFGDLARLLSFLVGGAVFTFGAILFVSPTSVGDFSGGHSPGVGLIWMGLVVVFTFIGQSVVALGFLVPSEGRIPYLPTTEFGRRRRQVLAGMVLLPPLELLLLINLVPLAIPAVLLTILLLPVAWIYIITPVLETPPD